MDGPLPPTRRLSADSPLFGHFHAAVFPYRPLKKGIDQLEEIANTLFETGQILSVLHLLNDDRDIVGVGESEFSRGTCWISPIAELIRIRRRRMTVLIGALTIGFILSYSLLACTSVSEYSIFPTSRRRAR
jgi:hypothetical protein